MAKMDDVTILNDGNPMEISSTDGYMFTTTPSTAKRNRCYRTDKLVPLTKWELKMPGVVIGQNRGMLFSSCRKISGNYVIPSLNEMNIIIVDEVSRELNPIDDDENKIAWKGNGPHTVKDVIADGQGQHWFQNEDGTFADDLWLKIAKFGYGVKGMLQPGLATDVGCKIIDHWGVERTITMGNTILFNSSLVKGLGAYESLEEFIAHGEEWGLTTMMKQWQSGDHENDKRRIMGTQPNSTNLAQTQNEIEDMLKPEARRIWAMQFQKVAWMKTANVNTPRGRAIAARPELINNKLIMNQIDSKAGNTFLRLAKGQFMAEGEYLKMFEDKLVFSLVYVHGMDPNEAARKAAETGLHGEIRVNPAFAGRKVVTVDDMNVTVYEKETHLDNKGRYIETALVRYPHGAPSETIIVKAYLDATVPKDVIVFPAPAANEDGTIPVRCLYAMRLQGADFDGDAVTAFTEKKWLEAQKRNAGKSFMVIPVNTEGTEKDKTLVTDESWEAFCQMKVESLSNKVGLIATSLKYFLSQKAWALREGKNSEVYKKTIVDHACAMGDDIDEFKHGKANNDLIPFVIPGENGEDETLYGPYFNRYACKYKSSEDFSKTIYMPNGKEKKPGFGVLDMYATATETLMNKAGLPIVKEVSKANDGKNRYYFTVHPVKWQAKEVELFTENKGEGQTAVALPKALEEAFGIKHGTLFTAKDLFVMLYKSHSVTCKTLMNSIDKEEDRDQAINVIAKINERYALARVAVIAWTKAMKLAKSKEEINAEEAMKLFTTLMVQHTSTTRSAIQVLTETGTFYRADGTKYEKTIFSAQRCFNYFLDICGDGLLLLKEEEPVFPEVSDVVIETAEATMPDMEKARKKAAKSLDMIGKLVAMIPKGIEEVCEEIETCNDEDQPLWFSNEDDVPDYDCEFVFG
jgi:hypothetical protein